MAEAFGCTDGVLSAAVSCGGECGYPLLLSDGAVGVGGACDLARLKGQKQLRGVASIWED